MHYVSTSPAFISGLNGTKFKYASLEGIPTPGTIIENDVWIGTGAYIKAGVIIHTGAVIGMNSVVTHDVGPYEIWAQNPARKIGDRFDENTKRLLLESCWWELDDATLLKVAKYFDDPVLFLKNFDRKFSEQL